MDGFERPLVEASGVTFDRYDEVRSGPLHGVGLRKALVSAAQIIAGTAQAVGLIRRYQPKALLLTGGWVGVPVALAAWLLRVPALIFLPDIEPGLTIRVLKTIAQRVAITVPDSAAYFREGQTVVTGYPVRQDVQDAAKQDSRAEALAHFGLDSALKTLMVFGGSRGARSINLALMDILPDLLSEDLQIIHVTGTLDWPDVEARRNTFADQTALARYHAYPYLHNDMGLALAAADLVVSRAGASILGEFPLFGVPSILIPYPYAWRYQKVNADYLADRAAAIRMDDERMKDELLPTIRRLLADPARLSQMGHNAAALAQPASAGRVATELLRLAGENV